MSLITRCPTCETMFRVVPDQLRVSEGWVRCGQCAEVFDATQNMVPPAGGAALAPPAPVSMPLRPPSTPASLPAQSPATLPPAATEAAGTRADMAAAAGATQSPPVDGRTASPLPADAHAPSGRLDHDNVADAKLPAAVDDGQEHDWLNLAQADRPTAILVEEDAAPDTIDTVPGPEFDFPDGGAGVAGSARSADDARAIAQPSFLRDEPPPSIWRRPAMRLVLAIVLLVLLALLGMQLLVKERDRVAAMQPAMRPVLEALCAVAACSIAPLRQIESIVIDSSSFSRVRGDDYRLGFSLKNTAPIDVAMPAIELSLTDPQDQPVIRRVILPAEFGARSGSLASASVWNGSLALTVQPDASAQRVAGYRLLVFYP